MSILFVRIKRFSWIRICLWQILRLRRVVLATFYLSAVVRSCPKGFLYHREVRRTFLWYKKRAFIQTLWYHYFHTRFFICPLPRFPPPPSGPAPAFHPDKPARTPDIGEDFHKLHSPYTEKWFSAPSEVSRTFRRLICPITIPLSWYIIRFFCMYKLFSIYCILYIAWMSTDIFIIFYLSLCLTDLSCFNIIYVWSGYFFKLPHKTIFKSEI